MGTSAPFNIPLRPGYDSIQDAMQYAHIDPNNDEFGYQPAVLAAAMEGKGLCAYWGGGMPYVAANFLETKDNASTIARVNGGVQLQTNNPAVDNDDTVIRTVDTIALKIGQVYTVNTRIQVSSAANLGIVLGFVTSGGTEIFSANPADGVFFTKAKNSANMGCRVVENGNAAVDSVGSVAFADATDVRLSLRFRAGRIGQAATAVVKEDCMLVVRVNGVALDVPVAQLTALAAMINTSAPTLQGILGVRVNGVTQRSALANYGWFSVDR